MPTITTVDPKIQQQAEPILQEVLKGIGEANQKADRDRDEAILKNREIIGQRLETDGKKLIAYIARVGPENSAISTDDIAPFGSMLSSLGDFRDLDLMIHSPGGNGVVAEKLVEMCRSSCQGKFRVIVPNMAKSAATLIALGADEVVMGYCSELGPIDPQKLIVAGGRLQQVSAQSIISARDLLMEQIQEAKNQGKDITGYQQQLASSTMDPAFIFECQKEVDFAIDFVKKCLPERMLKIKFPAKKAAWRKNKAEEIAKNLTSTDRRFIHGRMISSSECKSLGINVVELDKSDEYWKNLFELYVRAEVLMSVRSGQNSVVAKLFTDAHTHLLVT